MNKYILQSVGHSLALSLFFDGASTSALESLEATCNLIKKRDFEQFATTLIDAQTNAAKDAYYALTPYYLRKLIKIWVLSAKPTIPAFCIIALSSTFIGAYKNYAKGDSIIVGAWDCSLYAAADYFGFDCGLFGNVSCSIAIETFLSFIKKTSGEETQTVWYKIYNGIFAGGIGGLVGSFLLEGEDWLNYSAIGSFSLQAKGFGLLDKLTDGMAAAKPHHFVLCSSVFSAACILHTADNLFKKTWLKKYVNPTIASGIGVAVASIISYNIYAYAALPASVTYAVMFMELDKCVMKHLSQPSSALAQPQPLGAMPQQGELKADI